MSKAKFIAEFLGKCAADGVDAREEAIRRVNECDEKLKEIGIIHRERANLVAVLFNLGDDTFRQRRAIIQTPEIEFEDDTEAMKDLRRMILGKLKTNGPMAISELIESLDSFKNDHSIVRSIKYLGEKGLVEKNEDNKIVIKESN
jgi:hypothetical protein